MQLREQTANPSFQRTYAKCRADRRIQTFDFTFYHTANSWFFTDENHSKKYQKNHRI